MHFLENPDHYVLRVLCYPRDQCSDFENRLNILLKDGFLYFVETGTKVLNIRVLGKGYTGVTTIAFNKRYGLGALKILRLDSRRRTLVHEAEMLMKVQQVNVAPKLYTHRDFYVFREYVPAETCTPVSKYLTWLLDSSKVIELKAILRGVLETLYKLDIIGVDHTEISRPGGHVFYCADGLKILDWDSARLSSKPVNLTSFTSFLLFRFERAESLRRILGYEHGKVLYWLKKYKQSYSLEVFISLLSVLGLA